MTTPNDSPFSDLPDPSAFSDEDFATSTARVEAARNRALANPRVADLVERKSQQANMRVETLASLRKARGLTQAQLTDVLGMTQGEVSRLERRDNVHLATLAKFIEATGGSLRITAVYGDDEVEVSIGALTSGEG